MSLSGNPPRRFGLTARERASYHRIRGVGTILRGTVRAAVEAAALGALAVESAAGHSGAPAYRRASPPASPAWSVRLSTAICLSLLVVLATPGAAAEEDVDSLFARGMDLYRGGDYNGAAALFVEAASLRPSYLEARYYAGESLLKGFPTDLPGAEAQFLEVLKIRPRYLDGMLSLARTYYEWGRYEKSGEILKQVLATNPDQGGALYYSGAIAARQGDNERAVPYLRAALKDDPGHIPSRVELGLALGHLARDEEALAAFNEVLKTDPDNERALFGAGNSLKRLGRDAEAKEALLHFQKVAASRERGEMKEARIQIWLRQTRMNCQEGRMEDARRSIARLLEEFPTEPRGLASLARLQEKGGDDAAAIATYEKILRIDPENLAANHQLIGLYLRAGRKDRAAIVKSKYEDLIGKVSAAPKK
jgi:tetratricopeptide (TPR) repeat protein